MGDETKGITRMIRFPDTLRLDRELRARDQDQRVYGLKGIGVEKLGR